MARRTGFSLFEVLVALVIMSVGIMAVLSVFPVSIQRGVKATKLTRATDLRYSAEAMLDVFPMILNHPNQNFVFDPAGVAITGANTYGPLPRYSGTWQTEQQARQLVFSPDSWDFVFEGLGSGLRGAPQPSISVAGLGATGFMPPGRALIFNQDHKAAQARTITGVAGDLVSFTDPLPAGFVPEFVRIDNQQFRYSWLLTGRNNGATTDATIVVFFNRSFSGADEATFPAAFTAGSTTVTVGRPAAGLVKGTFIFDASNCFWYRIENIQPSGNSAATIILDAPASTTSPTNGLAMAPGGIVDVYPIASK